MITAARFVSSSSPSCLLRSRALVASTTTTRRTAQLRFKSATTTTAAAEVEASTKAAAAASKATTESTTTTTQSSSSVPIAQSLLAAAVAICTVSATAAIVENATAASVPKYDPQGQRFDEGSFGGRFCRMLLACDPRLLLYTDDQVGRAKAVLDNYKESGVSDRVLWESRRMVESALHPDTGDTIPRPFRMSGYCPFNGPVCVAMVASTSTLPLLFWAWANQSQNALVNYFNRNASSPMTNETLAKSYTVAVGSALAVAFGLATAIQRRFSPEKAKMLLRWVAFPSSVVASSLNCYIVRSPEIESGIPLLDENGNNVAPGETSQIAAARGVYSTTASRALLQAPVYFVPPVLLGLGPIKRLLTKNPALTVPVTTYLLLVSFGVGLPATVAIFPQISSIAATDVEERFQHLRPPSPSLDDGTTTQQQQQRPPYETYYYNKGL